MASAFCDSVSDGSLRTMSIFPWMKARASSRSCSLWGAVRAKASRISTIGAGDASSCRLRFGGWGGLLLNSGLSFRLDAKD